jgi:hypothetical protein
MGPSEREKIDVEVKQEPRGRCEDASDDLSLLLDYTLTLFELLLLWIVILENSLASTSTCL